MRLSSVVLSYNSARHIEKCIRSLARERGPEEEDEVWVVENGSTDGSVAILQRLERELSGFLKVLYADSNLGTTVSRNRPLRQATGRYIAVVDSDVEVMEGSIAPLLQRLDANPAWGILAPRLMYPDGRFQVSADVFPTLLHKIKRYFGLKLMERAANNRVLPTSPQLVDYAISAFWIMRREVLERVGLLDENIFYSPEDVDYCLRVWKAGYTVVYDPTVAAIHDAQEISRGFRLRKATIQHLLGLLYYFRKHRYLFGRQRLYRQISRFRHPLL
jgi:GT2 family glycosyltransferase